MFDYTMRIPIASLCALLWAAAPPLGAAGEDAKEIVRRALRNDAHNSELEQRYTFIEHDDAVTFDGAGAADKRESMTWDVIPVGDSQFRRLTERDGRPLSPKEEREQEAARQKQEAQRKKTEEQLARETPEQRQKRLAERESKRSQIRRDRDEALEGMDCRLVGEEEIDGRPVWVIEGRPRPGYKFNSKLISRVFSRTEGRIWVAKDSYQPVKVDVEITGTISVGGILARIYKGTHIHLEFAYVNGEVWLPKQRTVRLSSRFMLVKGVHAEVDSTFSGYKKFTVDSRFIEEEAENSHP